MADHKKDIHKIDNWLIRMGWLAVVSLLFANGCTSTFEDKSALELASNPTFIVFAVGAIVLLSVGYAVRRRENQVTAVWNILEHTTEVSIAELERSTGFARPFIQNALHVINRQPGSYYVWDDMADVIVDGRMRARILVVKQCESCGANVNQQVSLDLPKAPACASCGSPVTAGDLNKMKLDQVRELRVAEEAKKQHQFSVLLFIVLLLVFWPAAVAYAVWASGAVDSLFKQG
jgi:hypothetical protein